MKGKNIASAILVSLVYASLLLGCSGQDAKPEASAAAQAKAEPRPLTSPEPVATDHTAYAQLVAQAGEHWRDLAEDVADRVFKAYKDRSDLLDKPLYLNAPNNRPFTVAFYHLLRTELVSRGLQVSYNKEPRSVILEYNVQTVPFNASRRDDSSRFEEARHSDSEIIVNARMFYHNRFVMHCSSIRYINEDDLALYIDPQNADPLAESSRNIRITKK